MTRGVELEVIGKPSNFWKALRNVDTTASKLERLKVFFRKADGLYRRTSRHSSIDKLEEYVACHNEVLGKYEVSFSNVNDVKIMGFNHSPGANGGRISLRFVNDSFWTIEEVFFSGIYEKLDCKNKTVVDIGGNIGDSAIFFALNGAKHVFVVEPDKKLCEIAKENARANRLENKITVINAAVGWVRGEIIVDGGRMGKATSSLAISTSGRKIPMYTLENLLDIAAEKYPSGQIALKMDCEGAEYDALLSAKAPVLKRISGMIVESHLGDRNLRAFLEKIGFEIESLIPPAIVYRSKLIVGLFHAQQNKPDKWLEQYS